MSTKKDFATLVKTAERQGWRIEATRNGHKKWLSPSGEIIISGSTESDPRGLKNHLARMKRAGYNG